MTIRHVHFAGLTDTPVVYADWQLGGLSEAQKRMFGKSTASLVANYIKAKGHDQYIFIVTVDQIAKFQEFVSTQKLDDYITFKMKKPITNGNHESQGRRLYLIVFKQKD